MPIKSVDIAAGLDSSGVVQGVAKANAAIGSMTTPLNNVINKAIAAAQQVQNIGLKPVVIKVDQLGFTKIGQQFDRIRDKIALQQAMIGKSSFWADIEKARQDFDRKNARVQDPWQRGTNRIAFNSRMEGVSNQAQALDDQLEAIRAAEEATQKRLADERAVLETVKGLQREYDRLALSKEQILRADLASRGATQDQVDEAVKLRQATDELAKQKSLQEDINRLMLNFKEQGTKKRGPNASSVDVIRSRAQGVYGDNLPENVSSQLAAADKQAAALDKRRKNLGFAMLTLGRGVQDFQAAGLMGIVNNVEGLGVAMGMSAGAAGALTLGIVGLQVAMPLLRNVVGDFVERNLPSLAEGFSNATKSVGDFFDTSNKGSTSRLRTEVKALSDELTRLGEKGQIQNFDRYDQTRRSLFGKSRQLSERESGEQAFQDRVGDHRTRDQLLNAPEFADRAAFLNARLTGADAEKLAGLGVDRKAANEASIRAARAAERAKSFENTQADIAAGLHGTNAMASHQSAKDAATAEAAKAAAEATKLRDQLVADEKMVGDALQGNLDAIKELRKKIAANVTMSKEDRAYWDKTLRAAQDPVGMLRENEQIARRRNAPAQTLQGESRVREMRAEAGIVDGLLASNLKLRDVEFERTLAVEKARMAYNGVAQAVIQQYEAQSRQARSQGAELQGRGKLDSLREETRFTVALAQSGTDLNSIAERRARIEEEYRQNLESGMSKRLADEIKLVQLVKDEAEQRRKVNDELKRGAVDLANPGLSGRAGDINKRLQMGEITPDEAARLGAQAKALNLNDRRVSAVQDIRSFGQGEWENTRTFRERQTADLTRLTAARDMGFIDPSTFNRSLRSRARDNVATGEVGAVQAGSVEAYALTAKRDNQSEQYLSNLVGLEKETQRIQIQIRDGINQMKSINDNLAASGESATAGDSTLYPGLW